MSTPDGSARPLSFHEHSVLLGLERSLGSVPALRRDWRRWVRPVARTLASAVLVLVALLGLAVLVGPGGFALGVVALGVVLFGVTLVDVLASTST